jgi:biotin transporter BioY
MWLFGTYVAQAIIVGVIAQRGKGRTGLVWGLAALILAVVFGYVLGNILESNPRAILDAEYRARQSDVGHFIVFILMTAGPAFLLTLGALFTMPKPRQHA